MFKIKIVIISILLGFNWAFADNGSIPGTFEFRSSQQCAEFSNIDEMLHAFRHQTTCEVSEEKGRYKGFRQFNCTINANEDPIHLTNLYGRSDVFDSEILKGRQNDAIVRSIIIAYSGAFCGEVGQISDFVTSQQRFQATR